MLSLQTVNDMVNAVRDVLQDLYEPFRYEDEDILLAINLAFLEGFRLRPDIFIDRYQFAIPQFEAVSTEVIPIEPQFKMAFLYGAAAYVITQDAEDIQDARAGAFLQTFRGILIGSPSGGPSGPTPLQNAGQQQQG